MIYKFECPHPCTRVIQVDADNDEEAIWKLINAGAMTCRNGESNDSCIKALPFLFPLPKPQLKEAVRLTMLKVNLPGISLGLQNNVNSIKEL